MTGKEKCRILKEIRQTIADENDIPFVTEQCPYKGNCKGTCPRCEAELQYLEKKLAERKKKGLIIKISVGAALIAGIGFGVSELKDAVEEAVNNQLSGFVESVNYREETETLDAIETEAEFI